MSELLVDVALPLPVRRSFTYRLPGGATVPARGCRVLVPFGPRRVIGVVTGVAAEAPEEGSLKDVQQVLDERPLPPEALLDLAAWVSQHYLAPPGECYRLAFPPAGLTASRSVVRLARGNDEAEGGLAEALRDGPLRLSTLTSRLPRPPAAELRRLRRSGTVVIEQELETTGFRTRQVAVVADRSVTPRGAAQAELLQRLDQVGGRLPVKELLAGRPSRRGVLSRLVDLGAVRLEAERELRAPDVLPGGATGRPELTTEQAQVLQPIQAAVGAAGFAPFLLHGVTASGKTEVYFRAIEQALAMGRGCLLLVPEIALTPLLVRSATARLGRTVAVVHSELSRGERHDQWWRIREGDSRVVVGARSAVFAPVQDLGLIVVDEEHEGSYKQEESPRYHARDVAVMRGHLEGMPVLLGTATPSVESYANVQRGKYRLLEMRSRVGSSGLPRVEFVDRRAALRAGEDSILLPPLRERLAECLLRGEQALLLLNRRGYATSLLCRECGALATCRNCSVPLTLHRGARRAECHYCGFSCPTPRRCEACRGEYLKQQGYGTERVVEAVRALFPKARVDRVDRDSARRRGALAQILTSFESGTLDVLVGTQMIAKGHDFPKVTLVGVIDADVGLGLPDFRAAERSFQLLTQVAGRAGRSALSGEVLLQTHLPEHYALRCACSQDYATFFEREMEFRRTMGYPPEAALVNLVLRARDVERGVAEADWLAGRLRGVAAGRFRVLGPALAPLARLRQEHRVQILLKGGRAAMREAVARALDERYGELRWPGISVDVDPVSVM